jgi:hypothetical protein
MFQGDRIKPSDTPRDLKIQSGDTVDVFHMQMGD